MDKTEKILELLSKCDSKTKMKVITECVPKIGTEEWRNNVLDLMRRMGLIKK